MNSLNDRLRNPERRISTLASGFTMCDLLNAGFPAEYATNGPFTELP
jgi:hypothetical protein